MSEQEPDYMLKYRNSYNLTENPFKTKRDYGSEMFETRVNYNETINFVNELPVIDKSCWLFKQTLELRRKEIVDDKFVDIWIPSKNYSQIVHGIFVLKKENKGLVVEKVCNIKHKFTQSFHILLNNYYLKTFDYVTVHSANLNQELFVWDLFDRQVKQKQIRITAISSITGKECNIEDVEAYWSNPFDYIYYDLRFEKIITKK
jgi:hypothetical protein